MEHEKAYTQRTMGREREQRSTLNTLGLSELEAVEYALILSREEEEHRLVSRTIDEGVFEGDFDDLPVPSSSLPAHGFLSSNQSSSSSHRDHHFRGHPCVARPITNEKVQVSPVFVPEPMDAGVTISPLRMCTPLPGSSTRPLQVVAPSGSSTHEDFPLISSSLSSSSSKSNLSSAEHTRSAWSTPLCSALSSRGTSSPYIGTPITGRSTVSLSSAGTDVRDKRSEGEQRPRSPPDSDDAEMDDDLKFVIELSLAEARSRGDI